MLAVADCTRISMQALSDSAQAPLQCNVMVQAMPLSSNAQRTADVNL